MRFSLNARTTRVAGRHGQITLSLDLPTGSQVLSGSHLLIATGRRPNTDDLAVEKAGVGIDQRGYITVNGRLESNVPGVWALGDVKGGPAFTHISYDDYQIVYGNLLEGKNLTAEGRVVPYSVFTDPQLGRVGMTEKQARGAGRKLKVADSQNWLDQVERPQETESAGYAHETADRLFPQDGVEALAENTAEQGVLFDERGSVRTGGQGLREGAGDRHDPSGQVGGTGGETAARSQRAVRQSPWRKTWSPAMRTRFWSPMNLACASRSNEAFVKASRTA